MKPVRWSLVLAICFLLIGAPALTSYAASGKKGTKSPSAREETDTKARASDLGSVKHSGKMMRNKRIRTSIDSTVEVVEGKISGLDKNGIYMDGEYFRIGNSKIFSSAGVEMDMKDLYYGLKARVKLSYGTIEKTTIYGMVKPPKMSPEEAKAERERRMSEGKAKGVEDRRVPREALEYEPEIPADLGTEE